TQRLTSKGVEIAATQVSAGVAAQRGERQQDHVAEQYQSAQADAKAGRELESEDGGPPQKQDDDQRQPEEVTGDGLQDEGEDRLAAVAPPGIWDSTGGR